MENKSDLNFFVTYWDHHFAFKSVLINVQSLFTLKFNVPLFHSPSFTSVRFFVQPQLPFVCVSLINSRICRAFAADLLTRHFGVIGLTGQHIYNPEDQSEKSNFPFVSKPRSILITVETSVLNKR